MKNKAVVLNVLCLIVGFILGIIGISYTIQNINYGIESSSSIAFIILSGFLILSGVIGYNIQSKK